MILTLNYTPFSQFCQYSSHLRLCYTANMQKQLYLILHDIRSAYNVGAIFRSADGAGISKIFLTGYTPIPAESGKMYLTQAEKMIAKTALGAENMIFWEQHENLSELLQKLKNENVSVVALEKTPGAVNVKEFQPKFPAALIVGNEVDGVSDETLEQCDAVVSIPMRGKKESLNVSVAAGIAMYELLR